MRTIGVNLPFLGQHPALKARLEDAAKQSGFKIDYYDNDSLRDNAAAGCEVFFGMIPVKALKECKALKWFQCSFAGVDRYTSDEIYPNPDVIVTNSAGAYGITISEHMVCTLLMMLRRIPEYVAGQQRRDWENLGDIRSIYGSVVTIIGAGDIGSNLAKRLKVMGATVRGVRRDISKPVPQGFDDMYAAVDIDKALSGADVVALCLPETGETKSLIDARRLQLLADKSYLLNVGRGSAVDQDALCEALRSGKLAGAAIDVTVPEPLPGDHPLWDAPNIIITPHVSGNMSLGRTCEIIIDIFTDNLKRYAAGQELNHVVDRKAGY